MSIKVFVKFILMLVIGLSMQCLKKDQIDPTVYIINPQENSAISGAVRIKAVAMDDKEVTCVEFFINNIRKGVDSIASNSVYEYVWNTTSESYGTKIITAKAYDQAGNIGESPSIAVTIESLGPTSPTYHSGSITTNETWTRQQSPHIITGDVVINATLTIKTGVVIQFYPDTKMIVQDGCIIARGSNTEPILFTSNEQEPSPGDWHAITFENSDNPNSVLDNCIIEYASNGIYVEESRISITNTTIQNCDDYGLVCIYGRFNQFHNNIITLNEYYPVAITIDAVYTLEEDNDFTGNYGYGGILSDAIEVFEYYESFHSHVIKRKEINNKTTTKLVSSEIKQEKKKSKEKQGIQTNSRWRNHNVPYLIDGYIYFEDIYVLTIDEGCVLGFDGNGIEISDGATLQATGVTFTSRYLLEEGSASHGDWEGIVIYDGNLNLQNCNVEYAGSNEANISIDDLSENRQIIINSCNIKYSETNGILIAANNELCDIEITNCRISNSYEHPVVIENPDLVQCLGIGNNFTNNYNNHILVTGGEIMRSCTWNNCGVPYLIQDDIELHSGNNAITFTLSPSVSIGFNNKLVIGTSSSLIANNATFTSHTKILTGSANPGDWKGIVVNNGNLNIQNCNLEYAGVDSTIIVIESLSGNRQVIINGCNIKYSAHNGISIYGTEDSCDIQINNCRISNCNETPVKISNPNLVRCLGTGNNFTNNNHDYVLITGRDEIRRSCTWHNCGVPYLLQNDLEVHSENNPTTFTLSPGVILGIDDELFIDEGSLLIANSVTFTSEGEIISGQGSAGEWEAIYVDGSINLVNCIIEYGEGSSDEGVISYYGETEYQSLFIDNCIIRHCEQSGLSVYIEADEQFYAQIKNTRITNCGEYPVVIYNAENIKVLGPGNDFTGNGNDMIWVPDGGEVMTSGIWYNCGVPYFIENDIEITSGWQNYPPTITIMPGVIMKFAGCYLSVEEGTLIADGSAGTIVFTADEDNGEWDGIIFNDETNDYLTRLNHCIIQYGGWSSHTRRANIFCNNSAPRITNCDICYSRGWGIALQNSLLDPDTLRRYNRFYNNDSGDVYIVPPDKIVDLNTIERIPKKTERVSIIKQRRENRKHTKDRKK
jgi:hypothetical protein